jgi:hypothetical protein
VPPAVQKINECCVTTINRFVLFFAILLYAGHLSAQELGSKEKEQNCLIGVRVIEAMKKDDSAKGAETAEKALLGDVGSQLAGLPLTNYRTVDYVEKKLKFKQHGKFVLQGVRSRREVRPLPGVEEHEHHMIAVLPHSMSKGWVHLTVDWEASDGTHLVNASMRVPNGKNLILGNDGEGETSTIICIKAQCDTK